MTFNLQRIATWLGIALLLVLAWFVRSVIAYFLVAAVISFIGVPVVDWLCERKIAGKQLPRWVGAMLVLIGIVLVIVLLMTIIFPPLVQQATSLSSISGTDFQKSFGEPVTQLKAQLTAWGFDTKMLSTDYVKQHFMQVLGNINFSKQLNQVVTGVSGVVGWIFSLLFITFFFLKEKFLVYRLINILTPDKYEPQMHKAIRGINEMLGKYFRSIVLQIIVFATYIFIGLSIAGEKYALTVALFSGIVNLVSYIGPLMGLSFALLFSFCSHIGADFYGVILPNSFEVLIVYLIAIALDNFVSYPLIFSQSLKVHPLELFFIILCGGQLAGLTGMILAAPLYTILRIIAKEFFTRFEIVKSLTKGL